MKSYNFGLRIFGLLCGWFVLLFIIELFLRVILYAIRAAISPFISKPKIVEGDNTDTVSSS